jgi:hypothetical protein
LLVPANLLLGFQSSELNCQRLVEAMLLFFRVKFEIAAFLMYSVKLSIAGTKLALYIRFFR